MGLHRKKGTLFYSRIKQKEGRISDKYESKELARFSREKIHNFVELTNNHPVKLNDSATVHVTKYVTDKNIGFLPSHTVQCCFPKKITSKRY